MSDKVNVKVIKCSTPLLWYKNSIGEVFECSKELSYSEPHYVVNGKYGFYNEDIIVLDEIDFLQEAGVNNEN